MNTDHSDNSPTLRLLSQLWRPALALISAVALPTPIIAWYAQTHYGEHGIQALLLAAILCGGSSLAALILIVMYKQTPYQLHAALAGIGLRTGLPLMIGVFFKQAGGPLAEAGVFGMIMVYYLTTLLAETILAARLIQPAANVSKAS